MAKILLGMSGGVDSSVSLHLLQQQGYEVEGVYMQLHDLDTDGYENAQKVARYFGVTLHKVDFKDSFGKQVYEYFIDSYKSGITPNPCVICNKTIKFGALFDFAQSLGIDKLATGHYVRSDGEFFYEGSDKTKDQSYFLAFVNKALVKNIVFPLGELTKQKVKEIAKDFSVLNEIAKQKESSEICFVEGEYVDVLSKHMDIDQEGIVYNQNGEAVGKHKGYMHYTIGKRRGFSVHGAHDPHYVTKIDAKNNAITVGLKDSLQTNEVVIQNVNAFTTLPANCEVKLRYRTQKLACELTQKEDKVSIRLKTPAYGVACGQIAVFYENDKLLGGGTIVATA
jgi:tRNA-specific 2-thiouridylase